MGGERCRDSAIGSAVHHLRSGGRHSLCIGQYSLFHCDLHSRLELRHCCHFGQRRVTARELGESLGLHARPTRDSFQRHQQRCDGVRQYARNCIIGPPQKNVDFTLDKSFKLGERQDLRFRADFFNLFNHPSFALPAATTVSPIVNGTGGGSAPITSTVGTPRLIQFSLKYSF